MIVAAVIAAFAALLWLVRLAPRVSPVAATLAVLVVGYVLGYELWHADAGPIPLTLDRLMLVGFAGLLAWRWRTGRVRWSTPCGLDWAVVLTLVVLSVSCVLNKPGDDVNTPAAPLFRLVVSFWTPAFLYGVLRQEQFDEKTTRWFLVAIASLGVYLGVTALLETAGLWSLVFPRYIANPELGLHFGRARGPALNSVSMGVYLGVAAVAAWLLIPRASRAMKLFWFSAVTLMSFGVLLTFTRSTWLGLAGAIVTVVGLQLPKRVQKPAFIATAVFGALFLAVGKDAIVGLKREDSAEVSAHSVQQRTAFAYISMQMFADHPLWGVGFGRFYDQKLPYLTDRRQSFELESLRGLHHHNTFLSLLTETGLLGLVAYLAVLSGMARVGWRLAHAAELGSEQRRLGLFLLGSLAVYAPSALFHDLTLVHSDQWMLFVAAGAATGCWMNQESHKAATAAEPVTFTAGNQHAYA